jgi:hypothetical protein
MDPTGCHAIMSYSVMLSDLEPRRNGVDDSTGKSVPQGDPHFRHERSPIEVALSGPKTAAECRLGWIENWLESQPGATRVDGPLGRAEAGD